MAETRKILIVEDEDSLLRALVTKVGRSGYQTIGATNGEEGLAAAFKHHPDLILLDIIMPKMNGISMLKQLRQDNWGKTVPVILLTNDANPEHISETIKENATDYLIKADWHLEQVISKINSVIKPTSQL